MNNYEDAKIYCFEPDKRNWKDIARKYDGTNVSVFPYAIGNVNGQIKFYETPARGTSSTFKYKNSISVCYEVPSVTLDVFAEQHKLNHINHLFLDIQGAEHFAFMGAQKLLERHAIDVIIGEAILTEAYGTPDSFYESYSLLQAAGYILVGIYDGSQTPHGRMNSFDYIFALPQLVQALDKR
jgi:FkbM family methyltransferase